MKLSLLLAAALAALPAGLRASAGIAGADVLKIPVEARGWGIATAYSAVADDVGAIAYNPAGLCLTGEREVRLTHFNLLEGTYLESLLTSYPMGRWGTLGGVLLYRGMPRIDNKTNNALDPPVAVSDWVFGGYLAFRFSHLMPSVRLVSPLAVGLGIKSAYMKMQWKWPGQNMEYVMKATALDLGFLLTLDPFRVALAFQNIGGRYDSGSQDDDPLPQTMRAAVGVIPYEDSANFVIFALESASYIFVSSSQKEGDEKKTATEGLATFAFGAEYWRLKKMGVRLGYLLPWGTEKESFQGARGLAVGGSVRMFTDWLTYQLDLAYHPYSLGSARQDAFSLSLSVRY